MQGWDSMFLMAHHSLCGAGATLRTTLGGGGTVTRELTKEGGANRRRVRAWLTTMGLAAQLGYLSAPRLAALGAHRGARLCGHRSSAACMR